MQRHGSTAMYEPCRFVPVPAMTPHRPAQYLTVCAISASFSLSVMVDASPVVPQTTTASTPAASWRSSSWFMTEKSIVPCLKGVTSAVATPSNMGFFKESLPSGLFLCDISFRAKQFCQQNCAASCSTQGIMGQADKFVVVLRIRPQTADGDRHAAFDHPVKLRLRAVGSSK